MMFSSTTTWCGLPFAWLGVMRFLLRDQKIPLPSPPHLPAAHLPLPTVVPPPLPLRRPVTQQRVSQPLRTNHCTFRHVLTLCTILISIVGRVRQTFCSLPPWSFHDLASRTIVVLEDSKRRTVLPTSTS